MNHQTGAVGAGKLRRAASATSVIAVFTLMAIPASLIVGPSLVRMGEIIFERGADIDSVLRAYFIVATWISTLCLAALLVLVPLRDPRSRVVAYALMAAALTLLGIWILNRGANFTAESSSLTFFSAAVLLLTAFLCFLNARLLYLRRSQPAGTGFWAVLGLGFLGAGLDERFQGHESIASAIKPVMERIGLPAELIQDGITALYALGAIAVVIAFQRYFRDQLLKKGTRTGWILLIGIGCYALSVLNDSFDVVLDFLVPFLHPSEFMNFLEEMLEFVAATLFLSAALVSLLETEKGVAGTMFASEPAQSKLARVLVYALFVLTFLGLSGVRVIYPPIGHGSMDAETTVVVFADVRSGLDGVDQLYFQPELGLLAGNEGTSSILRFDANGAVATWADASSGIGRPDGIAFHNGEIIVADDEHARVLRFGMDGVKLGEIEGNWVSPEGVASLGRGPLYVADSGLGAVVRVDDSGGVRPVATRIDGLREPEQLAIDTSGRVYVTETARASVFRIGPGEAVEPFLGPSDGLVSPESIVFENGAIYVLDSRRSAVLRFDQDGRGGVYVEFARPYRDPQGLAFGARGDLFVSIGGEFRPHNVVLRIVQAQ